MTDPLGAPIPTPSSRARGLFFHILPELVALRGFASGHPGRCEGGSPCGFCLHFPDDRPSCLLPQSFWDWEKGEKLDYFHNGNPRYTRVTAMEYLNGQDCSLLLTATGEWGMRGRGTYSHTADPDGSSGKGHCSQQRQEVSWGTGFPTDSKASR